MCLEGVFDKYVTSNKCNILVAFPDSVQMNKVYPYLGIKHPFVSFSKLDQANLGQLSIQQKTFAQRLIVKSKTNLKACRGIRTAEKEMT